MRPHPRSVTLTSSDPIHGSALSTRISINDTEEEIWWRFIVHHQLMNHKGPGGLHFTAFAPIAAARLNQRLPER